MKLIKLKDKFILVSDEEIKEGDWWCNVHPNSMYIDTKAPTASQRFAMNSNAVFNNPKKIIAGIPELFTSSKIENDYDANVQHIKRLPSIDFSLLSEADCKTIGYVDVEKFANDIIDSKLKDSIKLFDIKYLKIANYVDEAKEDLNKTIHQCLIDMFKTAQSINDKMFSLEDMREAFYQGSDVRYDSVEDYIQSLQQTSWEVKVNELNQITKIICYQ